MSLDAATSAKISLKYPVAEVFNSTTRQTYLKNVLTGEIVEPEKEEI